MTTQDFVQEQLALQMPDVPSLPDVISPEAPIAVSVGTRGSQDDVNQSVDAFRLERQDPTNVTSYHDFHNLQIAFEPIWREIYSKLQGDRGVLAGLALGLQIQLLQLGLFEPLPIETEDDLHALHSELGFLIDRIRTIDEPPSLVLLDLDITPEIWRRIDDSNRERLIELAVELSSIYRGTEILFDETPPGERGTAEFSRALATQNEAAERVYNEASRIVIAAQDNPDRYSRLESLVRELGERLSEPHNFHIFATNSINFGILVTYRQKWVPLNYQVGDLVSTIPLAPKESRKYTKKRVVKKSRAVKEIENSLRIRKQDSQDTARSDAEIVNRAENKTNFRLATEGGFNIAGFGRGSVNAGLAIDATKISNLTKKDFRESVHKGAEEYKQENKIEISTDQTHEFEATEATELSNPNDELAVTYLFYELQRQYQISEEIHRLTPVVLVANEVPAPDDIDEDWLIAHDWIIRRVILDDSFLPALDFLSQNVVGEEFTLEVLKTNLDKQKEIVEQTKEQISIVTEKRMPSLGTLARATESLAREVGEEGVGDDETVARERLKSEAARENVERLERELRNLQSELGREASALETAAEKYTQALKDHLNKQTEITRLRIHIKSNILYYMQAIWSHEPDDQRFFRLRHLMFFDVTPADRITVTGIVHDDATGEVEIELGTGGSYDIEVTAKRLDEVADLDNLLGFKGNYMMFPLRKNNYVTATMMLPYVDEETGLRDPGSPANYTKEELISFIQWLHDNDPVAFDREIEGLRLLLADLLVKPTSDLVVVPTDSLYIEILPGARPLLEDFKLMHRAMDVKKVRAEVRRAELENIRLAARLLENEREDPDIEKKIVVHGNSVDATIDVGGES